MYVRVCPFAPHLLIRDRYLLGSLLHVSLLLHSSPFPGFQSVSCSLRPATLLPFSLLICSPTPCFLLSCSPTPNPLLPVILLILCSPPPAPFLPYALLYPVTLLLPCPPPPALWSLPDSSFFAFPPPGPLLSVSFWLSVSLLPTSLLLPCFWPRVFFLTVSHLLLCPPPSACLHPASLMHFCSLLSVSLQLLRSPSLYKLSVKLQQLCSRPPSLFSASRLFLSVSLLHLYSLPHALLFLVTLHFLCSPPPAPCFLSASSFLTLRHLPLASWEPPTSLLSAFASLLTVSLLLLSSPPSGPLLPVRLLLLCPPFPACLLASYQPPVFLHSTSSLCATCSPPASRLSSNLLMLSSNHMLASSLPPALLLSVSLVQLSSPNHVCFQPPASLFFASCLLPSCHPTASLLSFSFLFPFC